MTTMLLSPTTSTLDLRDHILYPEAGILSTLLLKDTHCQYTLFCLAAGTEISEHTSTRNALVQVIEGQGTLTLNGADISLEPGRLIFMPAHAPHALSALENLSFLLTLSDASPL